MKAIIPAAGYATRLGELTKNTPKPLLPVADKPIVEHIVDNILGIGDVDHIYIVTNHKFITHFEDWKKNFKCRIPVTIFDDGTTSNEDRLGQIGDIEFVIKNGKVHDDVIIVAGDNLFNFKLSEAADFYHKKKAIVNPLFDAKSIEVAKQLGTVVLDKHDKFTEFMEKSPEPKTTLVSQGVYFFPKGKLSLIKKYLDEGNNADKMGYFMTWLLGKEDVYGIVFDTKWFDIGWKEALEVAKNEYKGYK